VFGPVVKAGSVDLRFLNAGATLRDEVRDRLKITKPSLHRMQRFDV